MKLLIALFVVASLVIVDGTVDAGITTRSVEAAGTFLCGKMPAKNVKIVLKREDTDDLNDIIGRTETDSEGKFRVTGNSERFGGAQSTIDPVLHIYHKCDKDDAKAFQTFKFRFPRTYTTIGKIPRRQYDIGRINLQIKYPGQTEEKNPIV
uniref:Transthyretin-like family protein n=1 Tax=Panagrolaimus sp. JU765 TaxID=591449 RepID=A0AC34Q9V9_9BILA